MTTIVTSATFQLAIERIFTRVGFPEGTFQTLLISSGQVEAVLQDERVRAETITGYGRELSADGMLAFMNAKTVFVAGT